MLYVVILTEGRYLEWDSETYSVLSFRNSSEVLKQIVKKNKTYCNVNRNKYNVLTFYNLTNEQIYGKLYENMLKIGDAELSLVSGVFLYIRTQNCNYVSIVSQLAGHCLYLPVYREGKLGIYKDGEYLTEFMETDLTLQQLRKRVLLNSYEDVLETYRNRLKEQKTCNRVQMRGYSRC